MAIGAGTVFAGMHEKATPVGDIGTRHGKGEAARGAHDVGAFQRLVA